MFTKKVKHVYYSLSLSRPTKKEETSRKIAKFEEKINLKPILTMLNWYLDFKQKETKKGIMVRKI